ncbi:hypothetical protein BT96DRAFT_1018009 [Gymnopus androsaceus JB14]|uniref:Uncharacterized protein n=1 Tax=Gymnopus androsaceus JB14 TaxID=1447944 RepID=A0A6A4HRQ4_9AGAR|nr:hypothetical protein BT96DRAFT_1018009 [Gymnopus androsaceus JB14]
MTPSAQKLDQLGPDILGIILLMLHDSSRGSLFSISTANTTLYQLALPFIYRHCRFDISKSTTTARIRSFSQNETTLRFIRMITVSGHLCEITIRLSGLCFPLNILGALHTHHPSTRLNLYNFTRPSRDAPLGSVAAEEELARSPCLRLIHTRGYCMRTSGDLPQMAFERIAKLAPNLEEMSTTGKCACTSHRSRHQIESETSEDALVYRKVLKRIEMTEAALDVHSLRYLSSFAHLDKLSSLLGVSPSPEFLRTAASDAQGKNVFSSLKHLSFSPQPLGFHLGGTCFRVKSLPLHFPLIILTRAHHSSQQRHLGARFTETYREENAPRSSSSTLDRTLDGKHEEAIYLILASFCPLRRIVIHMDLGLVRNRGLVGGSEEEQAERQRRAKIYTPVQKAMVKSIWDDLALRKIGVLLDELVLFVGERYRYVVLAEESQWRWFRVKRSERDDRQDEVDIQYEEPEDF